MNTWMRIGGAGCVWSWGLGCSSTPSPQPLIVFQRGKEKDPPKWTMGKRTLMEFAKTHCWKLLREMSWLTCDTWPKMKGNMTNHDGFDTIWRFSITWWCGLKSGPQCCCKIVRPPAPVTRSSCSIPYLWVAGWLIMFVGISRYQHTVIMFMNTCSF